MAGRIPQSFINDLIARLDIVDVVESRMTLKKTGKNYQGLCPFHDEKTPSFSVSPDKQFFHCFGCQESGTALTFVMKYDSMEFVEAVEFLAQQLGLEVPREQGRTPQKAAVDPDLYEVLNRAQSIFRQSLRDATAAIEYLKGRGLTGEVARDFGIGYAPAEWHTLTQHMPGVREALLLSAGLLIKNDQGRVYDRFRDRITFPIRDTRGRVIGFGGRTLAASDGPKYLNSPETPVFHKGSELYGLYEARKALRRIDRLIVVEGYMDVVALAQHGVANAVATLGTATGEAHFKKLYRYADEVVCCFDGDPAGRQAAWKALENALPTLNEHRQLKFVFLPDGEDPDTLIRSAGRNQFDQYLDNAIPGLEFLIQRLSAGLDLDTLDGQANLAGLAAPMIQRVPEGLLRTMLQRKLDQLTGMSNDTSPRTAPRMPSRRVTADPSRKVLKLSERLLTYLLKAPNMWHNIPVETRHELKAALPALGFFGEMLAYVDTNPEADSEELLIQWSDHERYAYLLERAQTTLEIDENAMALEFGDGMRRVLEHVKAEQRRQALVELRDSPNVEEFRKYWSLHGLGNDYS